MLRFTFDLFTSIYVGLIGFGLSVVNRTDIRDYKPMLLVFTLLHMIVRVCFYMCQILAKYVDLQMRV